MLKNNCHMNTGNPITQLGAWNFSGVYAGAYGLFNQGGFYSTMRT